MALRPAGRLQGVSASPLQLELERSHISVVPGEGVAVVTAEEVPASGALTVDVEPATAELPPGATATFAIVARSSRTHLGWRLRQHHFAVAVQAEGAHASCFDATMAQPPLRWALPAAGMAVVAGFFGLFLSFGGGATAPGTAGVETVATEAPAIPAPVYPVGARTETFVDESRPTRAHAGLAAEPIRTLRTLILYPAAGAPGAGMVEGAAPAGSDGPFPLIVFAHGSGGLGERYLPLLEAWAGAGYVVAGATGSPTTTSSMRPTMPPLSSTWTVTPTLRRCSSSVPAPPETSLR